ncbi:hypothetical protein EON62_05470 [archaeon]|nr:MAG: hypothetical protein EON62_05470 [archaeon]
MQLAMNSVPSTSGKWAKSQIASGLISLTGIGNVSAQATVAATRPTKRDMWQFTSLDVVIDAQSVQARADERAARAAAAGYEPAAANPVIADAIAAGTDVHIKLY